MKVNVITYFGLFHVLGSLLLAALNSLVQFQDLTLIAL